VTRRLLLSYLSVAVFVLIVLEIPLGISFAQAERDRLTTSVERDAQVVGSLVEDQLQFDAPEVDPQLGEYPQHSGSRVLIVDRAGRTVHDSDAPGDPDALDRDYSTRPEIIDALAGERSTGTRPSETLGHGLLYVAVPVASGGTVHGAVRITYPTSALDARILRNWLVLAGIAIVVIASTALVGTGIARWVIRPTRQVELAVGHFATGDLDVRAPADNGPPEARELAQAFNAMADRLARLIRSQQAFVSDASHQLRSPLTSLRLELEELELDADRELREGIHRAIGETLRLSRLVNDLLALARADTDAPQPIMQDATSVLAGRLAAWRALATEQGVELVLDAKGPLTVRIVQGHLEQIVDNLLDNAITASPVGGTVCIRTMDRGERAEIHISDHGRGLDDQGRLRAFDRFWRAPNAAPGTGSGLGLAIARQLAHLSGAQVELHSPTDGGTDAVITLHSTPLPAAHDPSSGSPGRR
jgi:signal transduction histidine kinase